MDSNKRRELRKQGQELNVTVTIGKAGVDDSAVAELERHLRAHKLVKVRLLPSATDGGARDDEQAAALADATGAYLVDKRGHTAVFWRAGRRKSEL